MILPIMFFENEEEQKSFEMLFNEKDLIETVTDELQNNAIIQHRLNIEEFECKGKPCCGVMEVAVPYELYKRWRDSDRVN
ncbi:MAG: hypothetical protein NC393_05020 [Clostridium sp.]|nr:hypothetical protein [Clostridium sp.]MCM1208275.1 hypothetical protein [Ruminococcus sp.]